MNFHPASKNSLKGSFRAHIKDLMRQNQPSLNPSIQQSLREHLKQFLFTQKGLWGGFQPMVEEPDWIDICSELPQLNWAFPKVVDQDLNFYRNVSIFKKGPFQILEPADGELVSTREMSGCLVPGVAFSRQGHRLGRGRGYYDRALEHFAGVCVGVCFSIQFVEIEVPMEVHDRVMDYVVTDSGFLKVA